MKKNETLLVAGIALVVGILVGIIFTQSGKEEVRQAATSAPPPAAGPSMNVQQEINLLEGMVKKEPSNRNAWVRLGNHYYDTEQPVKAVEAYGKALELDPDDPNVLTDQGVMFRRLGWYDRAADNFIKANRIQPTHEQSLFNLGIVYRNDLKDLAKAKDAWKKYLALNPQGPGAEWVRKELELLESMPAAPAR